MKKLLFLFVALATLAASAQTKEAETLKKKLDKNTEATQDAKKAATASIWIERAGIMIDASNIFTAKLIAGFSLEQVTPMVGPATSTEEVKVGGEPYTKYIFPHFDFWTNGEGLIQFWQTKTELVPNALSEAYNNLAKAKGISEKDFMAKGVLFASKLQNQYQTDAMAWYSLGDLPKAAVNFEGAAKTAALMGEVDTTMIYYGGIANFDSENYAAALPIFEQVASLGAEQEGLIYYYIGECQSRLGEKDKAIATMEKGFEKYPQNASIVGTLINIYLASESNPEKLIALIGQAQKLDPKNTSLYLVESTIYDKLGKKSEAYAALDKAIASDSSYFNAFYNYGIFKVLEAEKIREQADKLDLNDTKGYNALIEQAIAIQSEAIAKLERAFEIDSTHVTTIDLLRQLYFPKRDESAAMLERYKFFDGLSKK